MVTRGDAKWSIYQGLRSLPRRPYLVAMWIVGGELRTLYAPWNNDEKLLELMASTMDLVREAAIAGESPELARRALDLGRAWKPVLRAADRVDSGISGGLLNAWWTFALLAQEIGGLARRYAAASWVANAATERWRDHSEPGPILVSVENAEEVDESSLMGQTLARFERILSGVSGHVSPEWDPARIRAAILGEPPEEEPSADQPS
jgi:hypothetical protein